MRERERRALERRREREEIFDQIKDVLEEFFLDPLIKDLLTDALRFHFLPEQEQKVNYAHLIENHARRCLVGLPEDKITAESQCHWLVDMVDFLAHARPALERAIEFYRKAGRPMPDALRKWAENPGDPPPKRRGPQPHAQYWTALRDQIIAWAIGWAVEVQELGGIAPELVIRIGHSSGERWRQKLSICRAVIEVLEELYDGDKPQLYHLPTYGMVWKAWQRYRNETRPNGGPRSGQRPLLPPQGLDAVFNSPGVDVEGLRQSNLKVTEDYVHTLAQSDLDDS